MEEGEVKRTTCRIIFCGVGLGRTPLLTRVSVLCKRGFSKHLQKTERERERERGEQGTERYKERHVLSEDVTLYTRAGYNFGSSFVGEEMKRTSGLG